MKVGKIPMSEDLWNEPYGQVIQIEKQYATVPVSEWDHKLKMWVVTSFMETSNKIIADDYTTIPDGNCRKCHQVIKPYLKKYFERHHDNGDCYCIEFSQELGYCEKCAKEKAAIGYINKCLPELKESYQVYKDGQNVEVKVYEDGSIVEEQTVTEIQSQKVK